MMRMNEPSMTHVQSLQACKDGIEKNDVLLAKLNEGETTLYTHAENYRVHAVAASLYTIPRVHGENPAVVVNLTKNDLKKLYETYFRDKQPGRRFYEALLASAHEKCPFCGGIGRPRNLDHFMPKARFPQFSVLPLNLIPSCRDCNMDGKGQAFAETAEEQILHPFLDAPHFFEQQWLFANYIAGTAGEPGTIQYYVAPPDGWSDTDKARVTKHFSDFDIAIRYATQAGAALTEVEAQRDAFLLADTMASFKQTVLQPVIDFAPFINHWKRVMYLALSNDL